MRAVLALSRIRDALALDQRFQAVRPPAHRAGAPSAGPSDASASPARRPWRGHRPLPVRAIRRRPRRRASSAAASVSSRSTSRLSRKVCTPARSAPGTLSRSGVEPVASTSLEKPMLSSLAILSSRRPTSISVARQPYFRVTPRSRHHCGRPQLDVVRGGLAGQHRRQQHAIIGEPRLVADHGDGVAAERDLGQFVDQTRGGHSVADDDQRFTHGVSLLRGLRAAIGFGNHEAGQRPVGRGPGGREVGRPGLAQSLFQGPQQG